MTENHALIADFEAFAVMIAAGLHGAEVHEDAINGMAVSRLYRLVMAGPGLAEQLGQTKNEAFNRLVDCARLDAELGLEPGSYR